MYLKKNLLEMAAILSKGDELTRRYMNFFLSNLSILVFWL